jgi:hypothetical protein
LAILDLKKKKKISAEIHGMGIRERREVESLSAVRVC